jgi:hypothetical protein
MSKVWIVLQLSNVDGEILANATPCKDLKSAQAVMDEEIRTLLSSGKYKGLDLDEIERDQNDANADCDFFVERSDTSFYIGCVCDDYYEKIDIEEKPLMEIC